MASLPPDFSRYFDSVPQYQPEFRDGVFFLTSNERNYRTTLSSLAVTPIRGNTIIGVSGTFSLDLLATRMSAPSGAHSIRNFIVLDKSPSVKFFWESLSVIMTGNLDEAPPRRDVVIEKINTLIRTHPSDFFQACHPYKPPSAAADIEWEKFLAIIQNGTSFASSDEKFASVQSIFRNGHFKFLQMDMALPKSFETLGEVLKNHDLHPDTIYTSNIKEWIRDAGHLADFYRSLSAIRNVNSIVVHSVRPPPDASGRIYKLVQHVVIPD